MVAFKLTGDYAHFSHPATIYSSLTYPIPPKTAIMGFLGAVIGEEEHYKLSTIGYSVKVNKSIVKKSFVFNGIKFALSSNMHIKEGQRLINENLLLPAYDNCLKCSHTFNLLDSRGAISVTERVKMISQIRVLVNQIAQKYISTEAPV